MSHAAAINVPTTGVTNAARGRPSKSPVTASGHERSCRPSFATSELKVTLTRLELLLVDLAAHVGASLEVMERDAKRMRGARPFVFSNLRTGQSVAEIARFIEETGGLA